MPDSDDPTASQPQRGLLKSGAALFASHGGAALLSFLRNVIVARALGVEEFGIASTFAMVFAFVEMATDTGLEKLIVRDPEGDSEKFQGTMQSFFVIRGVIAAGLMFLLAGPFARYMGLSEISWAYQVLALGPLIRGFVHFDIYRQQRAMKFAGLIASTLAAPTIAIVVILVGLLFVSDFRIVLCSLIAFQLAFMATTHVMAKRPYRLSWNMDVARRSVRFGLPLLANGLLLFGVMQGDRLIIGGEIGIEVLGWFAVAWVLISTPAFVMINTIRSAFMPKLSRGIAEHGLDRDTVTATIEAGAFSGIALVAGFFLLGPAVVLFVYGTEFSEALTVLKPLAAAFAMRLLTNSISTIAIAGDDTPTPLTAGITRALFLPLAYYTAVQGYGPVAVAWIVFAGEATSFIVAASRLVRTRNLDPRPWIPSLGILASVVIIALAFDTLFLQTSHHPDLWMTLPFVVLGGAAFLLMRALRGALGLSFGQS